VYFIAHTEKLVDIGTIRSSLLTAAHKHTKRAASITLAARFIMKKAAQFRTAYEKWFYITAYAVLRTVEGPSGLPGDVMLL